MADPRGYMTFKCQATAAASRSSVRDFGNAVGKVGDLNVLNSIGAGKIGQGLRTIASVSNTIRTGCGSLPTSIGSSVESGAKWVLDQTGIGSSVVDAVRGFNPGVANAAWGQAQQIFQKAKQGHFKVSDIPGSLQDLQNLERLGRNIFTGTSSSSAGPVDCLNSPYALDLIARAPKHKFMFVVAFTFNDPYGSALGLVGNELAFVVKKSTRPNIRFQTEDVNYYNFRSKVVTKTEFEDMSMTFHDDMQNYAMRFYNAYRNAVSPITNMDGTNGLIDPEGKGMDFSGFMSGSNPIEHSVASNTYTASKGPLASASSTENIDMIKKIQLFHVYDAGRLMNVFTFLNPRISEMSLDDVDMAANEGNEMVVKFNYDSVFIATDIPANDTKYTSSSEFLPGTQLGSQYPLRYNGSAGAMNSAHASNGAYGATGASTSCDAMGGMNTGNNPLGTVSNMLSNAAGSVTNALNGLTSGISGTSSTRSQAASLAGDLSGTEYI